MAEPQDRRPVHGWMGVLAPTSWEKRSILIINYKTVPESPENGARDNLETKGTDAMSRHGTS